MSRVQELEKLIRKLRNHPLLWDDVRGAQVTRCISLAKKLCQSGWRIRYKELQTARLNRWMNVQ